MTGAPADDDLPEIKRALADRAAELFKHLYDQPATRGRNEMRWGRKGSLVLYLRGRNGPHWHCHESSQGGDMLAAIRYALNTDFAGVLDWARDWIAIRHRDRKWQHQADQEQPVDYDAAQAARSRRAAELSAVAKPIAGTLAETYLDVHRGIDAEVWPDAFGFADAATVQCCAGWNWWRWPALIVRASDVAGTVTGVQLVALEALGSAARHWDRDGKLKLSLGMLGGAAVRLDGDNRALLLAEGPETALSCWHATGIETWANLGSIARAPLASVPTDRLIVVCADDDARDAQSNKALRDAIRGWKREGRRVVIVKPHRLTKRDKSDFNDVLQIDGPEAVRSRIIAAIEDRHAPGKRLPVAEARQHTADLIDATIDDLLSTPQAQDVAPFKVLRLPIGIGKTAIAIRRVVAEAANGAKIAYLVPTHKLGTELVGRIEAEAQRQGVAVTVDVWRGRNRPRPDNPDKNMCAQLPTIMLAHTGKVDPTEVCKICPAAAGCPYLAQQERRAQIWIGAHDLLWYGVPAPLKGADLVIIDEGFATRGLVGFTGRPRLVTDCNLAAVPPADPGAVWLDPDLFKVPPVGRVATADDLRAKLMAARHKMIAALRDHPDGGLRRERLIAAGLTAEDAHKARELEWATKHNVDISALSWGEAKKAIDKVAALNRMIPRFAALWHAAEDLLAANGPAASGRAVVGDHESEDATFRAVRLFGAESVAAGWRRTPTLHIDATVDMELLRLRVPHAELVGEVEAATPHMRLVQYPGRAFGKYALRNKRFLFKAWDWCVAYAARRGGDLGVVVPKEAEEAILAAREVPDFIKLHHFGALRGLDSLRNVRGLIVVGRPMASPSEVERIAGALTGRAIEAVSGDWYPAEIVQLHARDGSKASVEADRHPDPIAEAVRRSVAEDEVLQSIGRPRGLNRTEADPVEIVLLGNIPVPGLEIDALRQWEPPGVDAEIFARFGVVLESAGDAARVAGLTRKAVLRARENRGQPDRGCPHFRIRDSLYGNGDNLCWAAYQLAGPGRSRQRVVYDPRRIDDCRAWLTERLGPLAFFTEDAIEQPVADALLAAGCPGDGIDWSAALRSLAIGCAPNGGLIPHTTGLGEDALLCAGIAWDAAERPEPWPACTGQNRQMSGRVRLQIGLMRPARQRRHPTDGRQYPPQPEAGL